MRISRKKRPEKLLIPQYKKNKFITAPEVRILAADKENVGVFPIAEALKMAEDQGLDLVEINPKANPPVAQIIDFTNFKYQKEKEVRKQNAHSKTSDVKGIRLSVRISDHDMGIRLEQAKKFLGRGDKVKAEIILRGRENAKANLAFEVINKFFAKLSEEIEVQFEQASTKQANKVTALISKK